jgi:hypothetical protein
VNQARLRWLAVAVVGAVVCTIGDHLHVVCGVLFYPYPTLADQAWWVPPLFAASSLAAIVAVPLVRGARFGGKGAPSHPSGRAILGDSFAFFTAYAFTAFGSPLPNVVLGVLTAFWMARVLRGVPRWVIVYSLGAAIVGPLAEAAISSLGGFAYRAPDFLLVPRWLPALYLHVGFVVGPVRRWVDTGE